MIGYSQPSNFPALPRDMPSNSPNNSIYPRSQDPLHGITLKQILTELQARFGWEGMAREVPIRCFSKDPSINSSLTFLRRTPWARKQVEDWYVSVFVLK